MPKVSVTTYLDECILCDDVVPAQEDVSGDAVVEWACVFRLVYRRSFQADAEAFISEPAYFRLCYSAANVKVDKTIAGTGEIEVFKGPPQGQDRGFFIHDSWWQLSRKQVSKCAITSAQVLRLGRCKRRLSHYLVGEQRDAEHLQQGLQQWAEQRRGSLDKLDNNLTAILASITRLPVEVSLTIWSYLQSCATRSLLLVEAAAAHKLALRLDDSESDVCSHKLTHLSSDVVRIKGLTYLSKRKSQERSDDFRKMLTANGDSMVKIVIGEHGIHYIRVWHEKGASISFGQNARLATAWTAVIQPRDVRNITVQGDALKLRALSLGEKAPFGARFFWEGSTPFSYPDLLRRRNFYCHNGDTTAWTIRGLPGWRLMRYVPFHDDDDTLKSITMFFTEIDGICGIMTQFMNKSHHVGRTSPWSIYFALDHDEYLAAVWVRICSWMSAGPFLLIKTNKGRICNFGPFLTVSLTLQLLADCRTHGRIVGLCYDTLKTDGRAMLVLGLICRPSQCRWDDCSLPKLMAVEPPTECSGYSTAVFRTDADLFLADGIDLCYKDDRCIGMRIVRQDSTTQNLGQWTPGGKHVNLFNAKVHKQPPMIRFLFKASDPRSYVKDVELLYQDTKLRLSEQVHVVQDFLWQTTMEWWLSDAGDVIRAKERNHRSPA